MTFWDFCAPFYDFAERTNGKAHAQMLEIVRKIVPQNASVLEVAAGTGAISIAIADKVKSILCTDVSANMLAVAQKKAKRRGVSNVQFEHLDILSIDKQDNSFDVIIAGQVLHLLDKPQKAAAELRRIARTMVILPIPLTKNLHGKAKLSMKLYRLFGFSPKFEFDMDEYANFLPRIGFEHCEMIHIPGKMPMAVAVWKGGGEMIQDGTCSNPYCNCENCTCNPCLCTPENPCGCA